MIPERRYNDITFCANAATILGMMALILCLFGNLVTSEAESVAEAAYDTNWYSYPVELRIFIMLAIRRTQRPLHFSGYRVVVCTLENYGKVSSFDDLVGV